MMKTGRETFDKTERLCSQKLISNLFETGNIFYVPLFKVVWEATPLKYPVPAQVAFSVSKKGFKHAVTRNLIRRRMREAYRKNKFLLYDPLISQNIQLAFAVIFRNDSVPPFTDIENSMKIALEILATSARRKDKKC